MQLYTSLVRLKQAMNGGQMPPMTPVAGRALEVIDPELTPGLGALEEDEEKGLRCPVRGCGVWRLCIKQHMDKKHKALGGAAGIKRLLSIPITAPLASQRTLAKMSASHSATWRAASPEKRREEGIKLQERIRGKKCGRGRRLKTDDTVGAKNLRNRCQAQLSHKLIDLQHQIGRSPSLTDATAILGVPFVYAVERAFGSWTAAKEQCGLQVYSNGGSNGKRKSVAEVISSLAAYHAANGSLPTERQADSPTRAPVIPRARTIKRAMETPSWPEAMRRAAAMLNIEGGRYGLPKRMGAT